MAQLSGLPPPSTSVHDLSEAKAKIQKTKKQSALTLMKIISPNDEEEELSRNTRASLPGITAQVQN